MKDTDFIELRVYDDGDVALTKRPEPHVDKMPEKGVLGYGITRLEALKAELLSYGCDADVIDRSIQEVVDSGYCEEIIVK
jgi:hypothetical protein